MLLTRYGIREWTIITLAAALPAAAGVFMGWWWLVAVSAVVWLALASFFRSFPAELEDAARGRSINDVASAQAFKNILGLQAKVTKTAQGSGTVTLKFRSEEELQKALKNLGF